MEASWLETRWARPLYLAFVFCLALGLLQAIKLYLRRQRLLRDLRLFPAPPTHWFYGHQKFLQEDKMEKLEETVEKYPCAFPCWVGPFQAFFFIYDPDYAKTFLSRTGKGLLNLEGPKWFQHRRLLTPGFHCDILKTHVDVMVHSVNTMLAKWEKICCTQDTVVDVFEHINLMALDIIMKCAFSQETNCQINGTLDPYVKATFEIGKIIFYRLYNFWYHHDIIFKFSPNGHRFQELSKVLHQHTGAAPSDSSRNDWGWGGDKEKRDQLSEMSYTTMCIMEMFRLIPPVPSISRELSKPLTFPDGRSLPAGMTVVLSIWGLHHNPAVWKSPKIFDPLRFTKENSDQRHPYAFLPFSSGPRNCIGQQFAMLELKVAIALILLRFKVTPDLTRPPAFSDHIILKPKHGIHLHLKKFPVC
ncbi:Cytochrome P450 4X1 [Sciurus carolinensis]|uniref:Cytochrome P450 4X1 n=1 Tax=Sciurus carolinensis TaxID=30640 RepID=A0AA41SSV3_SCICA|nr:Cytochrome P450 4X1 [Sciurus carolinensis]